MTVFYCEFSDDLPCRLKTLTLTTLNNKPFFLRWPFLCSNDQKWKQYTHFSFRKDKDVFVTVQEISHHDKAAIPIISLAEMIWNAFCDGSNGMEIGEAVSLHPNQPPINLSFRRPNPKKYFLVNNTFQI